MPLPALKAALSALAVTTPSSHPTPKDSARVETTLFDATPEETNTQPPSPNPRVTNVLVKHSSAFNSERATGLNKLQQLQFVALLKTAILDEAPLVYPQFKAFKIVMTRTSKSSPAAPQSFCGAAVHTAALVGATTDGAEWTVLERGEDCEDLGDAVEALWGAVLVRAGKAIGGLKVGDKVARGDGDGENVEKVESNDSLLSAA